MSGIEYIHATVNISQVYICIGEKIVRNLENDNYELFIFDTNRKNCDRVASGNVHVMVS